MSNLSPTLRKAAVLIAALDDKSAEALLAQMPSEQAAKIRSALVTLETIDPAEQERVLAEFMRRQDALGETVIENDDVSLEIDPTVEDQAGAKTYSEQAAGATYSGAGEEPLAFLQHVEPDALAAVLGREQAQIVAAVVGRLSPQQAAGVLERLPASLATEALERMAWLVELSPEVEMDLARELRQQLAPQIHANSSDGHTMNRLAAVLGAMAYRQRQKVVLQLAERNAGLLGRLGISANAGALPQGRSTRSARFRYRLHVEQAAEVPVASRQLPVPDSSFDDLARLTDADLNAVLAAAHPEIVLLALIGADDRLVSRLLRGMSAREAAQVRERLRNPGPLRLRDVEQAQQELAQIAATRTTKHKLSRAVA